MSASSGGPDAATSTITAVIVSYDEDPLVLRTAIDSLLAQTHPPVEILVMDNGAPGRVEPAIAGCGPAVRTIACPDNPGYAALNRAAALAVGEYVLCLNPDATALPDCLAELVAVADGDAGIALVGAQILLADGVTTNAGANPLHPTGISPSGGYGRPREDGAPREVIVVSGACFLARRSAFLAVGGFTEDFFLYYEDVDLGWRLRIAGWRVLYCPRAAVIHDYEFAARPGKWFLLERNRLFAVLANYEQRTLVLLAPLLVATEIGLLAVAARDGWLREKLRAHGSLWRLRSRVRLARLSVAASRRRSDGELLRWFDDRFDSALIPRGASLANMVCVPYMWVVRRLVR